MDDETLQNAPEQALPEQAQPETALPEQAQPEPAGASEDVITLDSEGELDIQDSFWDGMGIAKDETDDGKSQGAEGAAQTPVYYTPDEFAEAFAGGTIDEAKLAPDVAAFYKAAMARQQAPAPATPPIPPVPLPAAPIQPPVQPRPMPVMSREQYAQLTETAKNVACANYLGIKPAEFDEFNAEHAQARNFAMQEIRSRAAEIASRRAEEAARARRLASEVAALDAEYQRKDPEFFAKHDAIMQDYLGRMPFRAAAEAIRAIQSGDAAGIRKFIGAAYEDYKGKGGARALSRKTVTPPPAVASTRAPAAKSADEQGGMVDAKVLQDMTPEEQAAWFVKNKFV